MTLPTPPLEPKADALRHCDNGASDCQELLGVLREALELSGGSVLLLDPQSGEIAGSAGSREHEASLGRLHTSAWSEPILRAFRKQPEGRIGTRFTTVDGRVVTAEINYRSTTLSGQTYILIHLQDASQMQAARSQVEQLNQLLREAERLTQLGSWELIHATGELIWSEGTYLIFGTDPESLTPSYEAFLSAIHPDDRALVDRTYRQSVETRRPYQITHRLQGANGVIKVVEERGTTTYSADGRPERSIGTVQDVSRLFAYEQELRRVAFVDRLTQLPNRPAALQALEDRLAAMEADHEASAEMVILSIDLDDFRAFNDTFGADAGDRLLQDVGSILRGLLPDEAFVARLEGDEYLIIHSLQAAPELPSEREAARLRFAADLQQRLAGSSSLGTPLEFLPSVAMGLTHAPEQSSDPQALLQNASTAVAEAKRRGKGQICLYTAEISQRIRERVRLESDLEKAISREQFMLYLQPQVDGSGVIAGAEMLLRWRHHSGYLIKPDVFIPLAERSGQIDTISNWVIEETCRIAKGWHQAGHQAPRLAINISAAQISRDATGLAQRLISSVADHGLDPEMMEFEITETALIHDPERSRSDLLALTRAGFHLAIDDFGTGYASLQVLHMLPVHKLKIDTSFVDKLEHDSAIHAIVKNIILMAHELGLQVLAEGVETERQWDILRQLGCDLFQGHLFGKAMAPAQFQQQFITPPHSETDQTIETSI